MYCYLLYCNHKNNKNNNHNNLIQVILIDLLNKLYLWPKVNLHVCLQWEAQQQLLFVLCPAALLPCGPLTHWTWCEPVCVHSSTCVACLALQRGFLLTHSSSPLLSSLSVFVYSTLVYTALGAVTILRCQRRRRQDFRAFSTFFFFFFFSCWLFKGCSVPVGHVWHLLCSLKMACDLKPLTGSVCRRCRSPSSSCRSPHSHCQHPTHLPTALWSDYPACDSTDTHMSPRDVAPSPLCLICLPVQ